MDPEELANALQDQPQQRQGRALDDGATATNPQTGERIVYRISNGGRGRWVRLSYETADPQSRERAENVQNIANVGNRTLPLATRFVERNLTTETGGIQNAPEVPNWVRSIMGAVRPQMINEADELRALSNQMVGANWQPGTTGMYNTASEMEMARQRYPAPTNRGPANMDVYLNMAEDVAVQREAAQAMRDWLSRNTNLNGFDQDFARREPEIRRAARNEAASYMRRADFANNNPGVTVGADIGRFASQPPPRPPGVPANARWNAAAREWVSE